MHTFLSLTFRSAEFGLFFILISACTTLENSPISGQGDIEEPESDPRNMTLTRDEVLFAIRAEIAQGITEVQRMRWEAFLSEENDERRKTISKFCYKSGTGSFSGKFELVQNSKAGLKAQILFQRDKDDTAGSPGFTHTQSSSATHEVKSSFNIDTNISPRAANQLAFNPFPSINTRGYIRNAIISEYSSALLHMFETNGLPAITSSSVDISTSFTVSKKNEGGFELNIVPESFGRIASFGPTVNGDKNLKNVYTLSLSLQTLVPKTSDNRRLYVCSKNLDYSERKTETEICVEANFAGDTLKRFEKAARITIENSAIGKNEATGNYCDLSLQADSEQARKSALKALQNIKSGHGDGETNPELNSWIEFHSLENLENHIPKQEPDERDNTQTFELSIPY